MKLNLIKRIALGVFLAVVTSCAVHEWPSPEEVVPFRIKFSVIDVEWQEMNRSSGDNDLKGASETTAPKFRYTIKMVPVTKVRNYSESTQEYILLQDITDKTELEFCVDAPPGDYDVMIWADYVRTDSDVPYYNVDNFAAVKFNGLYEGNSDYHDAFRGVSRVSLVADYMDNGPVEVSINMQRPFAKYELITTDLDKFIASELAKSGNHAAGSIDLNDYSVVLYYIGFYPDTYSFFTDKPVDASSGVSFKSTITKINETTASLGFDYVFVGDTESTVTVRVGVYDKNGVEVSMSESLKVPLMRSHHSILQGGFLMSTASGGVNVDTEYDGDYNIIIKKRLFTNN